MNQQMLKNIYTTFGEAPFRYCGQLVRVIYKEEADEYVLEPASNK